MLCLVYMALFVKSFIIRREAGKFLNISEFTKFIEFTEFPFKVYMQMCSFQCLL